MSDDKFSVAIAALVATCCFLALNVNSQIAEQKVFSCEGRPNGYYADITSGCQIYHMCDGIGRQFSYSCPNTTLFQQRMLICDHWYMVNCSKAELDYGANLLIGQREKPFVEDDAENPYHRTPRPDLLAHPSAAEYNIVYRTGRAQQANSKNLVGADSYPNGNTPAYFLPSHWSTEYAKMITDKPISKVKSKGDFKKAKFPEVVVNFKSNFKATTPVYPKVAPTEVRGDLLPPLTTKAQGRVKVNFPSNFKATTPVYPKSVPPEVAVPDGGRAQLSPPRRLESNVNFASNFKATTPVYPRSVTPEVPLAFEELPPPPSNGAYGISSIIEPPELPNQKFNIPKRTQVNFQSNFKATTPVYPKFVTPETPLAIKDPNNPALSTVLQPPKSHKENTVQQPSMYYEPPLIARKQTLKPSPSPRPTSAENQWNELRKLFLIPDYEFPLDSSATRPNYDQGPDSFQVNPFSLDVTPRKHA